MGKILTRILFILSWFVCGKKAIRNLKIVQKFAVMPHSSHVVIKRQTDRIILF